MLSRPNTRRATRQNRAASAVSRLWDTDSRGKVRLGGRVQMISEQEAVAIARGIAGQRGWAWVEPARATLRRHWIGPGGRWEVFSNARGLGAIVRVVIDAKPVRRWTQASYRADGLTSSSTGIAPGAHSRKQSTPA